MEEAIRLAEKAKFLAKLQILHLAVAAIVIFIPLFVPGESVLYGCWAICAAILIHERFQWWQIERLRRQVKELSNNR